MSGITNASRQREFRAASFRRRVAADLADLILIVLLGAALLRLEIGFPAEWPPRHFDIIDYAVTMLWSHSALWGPGLVITLGIALVGSAICRALFKASPGERLLNITLIDSQGQPAGMIRSLCRGAFIWLGLALLGIGYIWAAVDIRRQGLAEYLSGTLLMEESAP